MRDELMEAVRGAIANALVWEVESDVRAGELTHEEQTKVAQAALAVIEARGMIVPREPTERMLWHGGSAFDHPSIYMGGPSHTGRRKSDAIYRAMLAAAEG